MKIILIALPLKTSKTTFESVEIAPLALYLLASILKQQNHQVSIIDPCEFLQFQNMDKIDEVCARYIEKQIIRRRAEAIAFSVNSFNWSNSKLAIDYIGAKYPYINITVGGLHATNFAKHVLEVSKAQVVIRGEGEKTIVDLYETLEKKGSLSEVRGITYKVSGKIYANVDNEPMSIYEMKQTPLPCFELLPENNSYTQMPVESSRGCHYSCVFCSIPHRHCWKGLDVDTVLERTKHAMKFKNAIKRNDFVLYVDDCFTADCERAHKIFAELEQLYGKSHKFFIEARITDIINGSILQKIPPEMISSMQIGVECGYDEGLKKIHKGLTIRQLYEGIKIIQKYKYERHCFLSFIIGFPWETIDKINLTLDTIEEISSKYHIVCNLNWLLFLPSDLWSEKEKYNIYLEESIFDHSLWYGNSDYFFKSHPLISFDDILAVEKRVRVMQMKGPVGYRRSIGLEDDYKEPSSIKNIEN